ncbi:MAG: hypothetical protein ACT4QB_19345, partial [Gammaproteobacteria bacterium]
MNSNRLSHRSPETGSRAMLPTTDTARNVCGGRIQVDGREHRALDPVVRDHHAIGGSEHRA